MRGGRGGRPGFDDGFGRGAGGPASLPPNLPSGVPIAPGIAATDAITQTLATLPPNQLLDIMSQMKVRASDLSVLTYRRSCPVMTFHGIQGPISQKKKTMQFFFGLRDRDMEIQRLGEYTHVLCSAPNLSVCRLRGIL